MPTIDTKPLIETPKSTDILYVAVKEEEGYSDGHTKAGAFVLKSQLGDQTNPAEGEEPRGASMVGVDGTDLGSYIKNIRTIESVELIKTAYMGNALYLKVRNERGFELIYKNKGLISSFLSSGGIPDGNRFIVGPSSGGEPTVWELTSYIAVEIELFGGGVNKTPEENDAAVNNFINSPFWEYPNNSSPSGWLVLTYGEYRFNNPTLSNSELIEHLGIHIKHNAVLSVTGSSAYFAAIRAECGSRILAPSGSAITLAFLDAPKSQVFYGDGTVNLSTNLTDDAGTNFNIYPEWFDSIANIRANATNAVKKAIAACGSLLSNTVYFSGWYGISEQITLTGRVDSSPSAVLFAISGAQAPNIVAYSNGTGDYNNYPSFRGFSTPVSLNMGAPHATVYLKELSSGISVTATGSGSKLIQCGHIQRLISIGAGGGTKHQYSFDGSGEGSSDEITLTISSGSLINVSVKNCKLESISISDVVGSVIDIHQCTTDALDNAPAPVSISNLTNSSINIKDSLIGNIECVSVSSSKIDIDSFLNDQSAVVLESVVSSRIKFGLNISTLTIYRADLSVFDIRRIQKIIYGNRNSYSASSGNTFNIGRADINSSGSLIELLSDLSVVSVDNQYSIGRLTPYGNTPTPNYLIVPTDQDYLIDTRFYVEDVSGYDYVLFPFLEKASVISGSNPAHAIRCKFKVGGALSLSGTCIDSVFIADFIGDEAGFVNTDSSCNVNYR